MVSVLLILGIAVVTFLVFALGWVCGHRKGYKQACTHIEALLKD